MPKRKPNRKPSVKNSRRLLGPAVKIFRDDLRHLSQDGLAQAAGINPSTLSRYENGTAFASYESMCRIAAALAVPLEAISYPVHTIYVTADGEAVA